MCVIVLGVSTLFLSLHDVLIPLDVFPHLLHVRLRLRLFCQRVGVPVFRQRLGALDARPDRAAVQTDGDAEAEVVGHGVFEPCSCKVLMSLSTDLCHRAFFVCFAAVLKRMCFSSFAAHFGHSFGHE